MEDVKTSKLYWDVSLIHTINVQLHRTKVAYFIVDYGYRGRNRIFCVLSSIVLSRKLWIGLSILSLDVPDVHIWYFDTKNFAFWELKFNIKIKVVYSLYSSRAVLHNMICICIENEVLNLIIKYIKYINHTYVYVKIKIYDIYGNSLTSNKSSSPSSEPLLHVFCADVVNGITIN